MFSRSAFLAVALTALTALPSAAVPLVPNSGWLEFDFGGVGSPFSDEPFTFSLSAPGVLTVTDAFIDVDQFKVFDTLVSLGLTSAPLDSGATIGSDYDAAAASPDWSTGMWLLGPGLHSITGLAVLSGLGSGGAALRVDVSRVPVPAAAFMMLTGLAGLVSLRRRGKA